VKLGVGGDGNVHGGGASQLGVLGAVGSQKDLGREDAHGSTLLSPQRSREVYVLMVLIMLPSIGGRRRYNAVPEG